MEGHGGTNNEKLKRAIIESTNKRIEESATSGKDNTVTLMRRELLPPTETPEKVQARLKENDETRRALEEYEKEHRQSPLASDSNYLINELINLQNKMMNTAVDEENKWYDKTLADNRQNAETQRNWEEQMSNTAHQREVIDLQKAGLNPVLAANNGASTPTGSMATGGDSTALQTKTQKQLAMLQTASNEKMQLRDMNNQMGMQMASLDNAMQIANLQTAQAKYATDKQFESQGLDRDQAQWATIYNGTLQKELAEYNGKISYAQMENAIKIAQMGADASIQAANIGASASKYAADKSAKASRDNAKTAANASMYASDNALKGQKYSSDNALKGSKYGADKSLEGTKYAVDNSQNIESFLLGLVNEILPNTGNPNNKKYVPGNSSAK